MSGKQTASESHLVPYGDWGQLPVDKPYRVEPENRGCVHCKAGESYVIAFSLLGREDEQLSSSYEDEELADDIARYCNDAFSKGVAAERAATAALWERVRDIHVLAGDLRHGIWRDIEAVNAMLDKIIALAMLPASGELVGAIRMVAEWWPTAQLAEDPEVGNLRYHLSACWPEAVAALDRIAAEFGGGK